MTGSCVSSWMLCVVMGGRLEAPWANTQRLSLTMSFFDRRSDESGMLPRRQISYMRWPGGKQEKCLSSFPKNTSPSLPMSFWISSMVSLRPFVTAWPRSDSTLKLLVLVGKMRKATCKEFANVKYYFRGLPFLKKIFVPLSCRTWRSSEES